MNQVSKIALGSIIVGVAVLALKFAAYWLTGSVALYSDAMESIVNVAAAFAAFIAVRYASKPADQNHPYGHHKAEYLAAVLEGVMIVLAAIAILIEAWHAFRVPRVFAQPGMGLAINAAAGVLNLVWARYLIVSSRSLRSPALYADGKHLMIDVVSSAAVIGGFALAAWTGWMILDPLLAAAVALNVLWSGWGLVRQSVGGLMDEAPGPEIRNHIREIISQHAEGALEAHDLRTRRAGQETFIDFHLVVPGSMAVADSHEICDRIEEALYAEVPGSIITIHVEPEEKAKHSGIVVV
ncbi:cation diffusion facilitator family transporter [Breoghania sp.]|uniref:cation diffusion facilitator family transporter n=1 Tax=Breoghania sp. TaxID=2065378 RepID=UPI0026145ED5|nr:cation diffusion facilitator family transporter [Breoghania sp.]MDJ0933211.1 cation diffusion facilitator family transporter [Breoghania sp.]